MPKLFFLLPYLALTGAAAQQSPSVVPAMTFPTPKIFVPSIPKFTLEQGCPLGISAHPGGSSQSLAVVSVEDAGYLTNTAARTGVSVRLASFGNEPITHLTVEVSYRVFAQGVTPVSSQSAEIQRKTFELTAQGAHILERNLVVAGHVKIDRVRVLKVDYSDGTHWKATTDRSCSVKPSPVVLVGER